jgi:ATP-dependent Zn protease
MRGIRGSGRRPRKPKSDPDDGALVLEPPELHLELPTDMPRVRAEVRQAAADHLAAWESDLQLMALHESAHAICAAVLGLPVKAIDTKHVGYGSTTLSLDDDDQSRFIRASADRARIVMLLAASALEELILGEITTGSARDLYDATYAAHGYYDGGLVTDPPYIAISALSDIAPSLREAHNARVVALLERCRLEAAELVARHRESIVTFARVLYDARSLEGTSLAEAFAQAGVANPRIATTRPRDVATEMHRREGA